MAVLLASGVTTPYIPIPSELQFLDAVYVNGESVDVATGYDRVEDAISRAIRLPVPSTSNTTISYTTLYAIDTNGNVTSTPAYSNFSVFGSKYDALSFAQSAVANGGSEKTFSGIASGYYLMIATENYGAVQYYAYLFV